MNTALCYVFPDTDQKTFIPAARRFVDTYQSNPPGEMQHSIWVLVNSSGKLEKWMDKLFSPLPCQFMLHNNYGKDIGAFQMACSEISCDLMVCLGSFVHFHKPGWMDHIIRAYQDNGPAVYGAWGFHAPQPHLRTTAFWMPPELLQAYPHQVADHNRYAFEHGFQNISLWTQKMGFEPRQLTWKTCCTMDYWHPVSREDSLFIDQHIDRHDIK